MGAETPDLSYTQAKSEKNTSTLISQALENGRLGEAEGQEIMNRLITGKEAITWETKTRLSAFLAEVENGRNWQPLKWMVENAPVSDRVQNSTDKKDVKISVDVKTETGNISKAPEQTDSSFVWDAYDSIANNIKNGYEWTKSAIVWEETGEQTGEQTEEEVTKAETSGILQNEDSSQAKKKQSDLARALENTQSKRVSA